MAPFMLPLNSAMIESDVALAMGPEITFNTSSLRVLNMVKSMVMCPEVVVKVWLMFSLGEYSLPLPPESNKRLDSPQASSVVPACINSCYVE